MRAARVDDPRVGSWDLGPARPPGRSSKRCTREAKSWMDETVEIEVANGICTRRALSAEARRLAARMCNEAETQAVSGE